MEGTDAEDAALLTHAGGTSSGDEVDAGAEVISLHARRLPPDPRAALPDMSKYDRLLTAAATTRQTTANQKGQGA